MACCYLDDGKPGKDQWEYWQKHVNSKKETTSSSLRRAVDLEKERGKAPRGFGNAPRKRSKGVKKSWITGANLIGYKDNCIRYANAALMRKQGYGYTAAPGAYVVPKSVRGNMTNAVYAASMWRNKVTGRAQFGAPLEEIRAHYLGLKSKMKWKRVNSQVILDLSDIMVAEVRMLCCGSVPKMVSSY